MLECVGLSTGYPGRPVSDGLDLTVRPGEILTLVGPNGSGKTTLLKTMAGLLPPLGGMVRLEGRPLSEFSPRQLAQRRAYLPQYREVPELTVGALIKHGRFPHQGFSRQMTAQDRACVSRAMALTGITDLRDRPLPTLSGGQRQQAYLAMTIAQDTPLLFWDELTTYLDVKNRLEMLELAQRLRSEGRTVVMILHELDDAFRCSDRICLLDDAGHICGLAPPEEVFRSGEIDRVFGVQTHRVAAPDGTYMYAFTRNDHEKRENQ